MTFYPRLQATAYYNVKKADDMVGHLSLGWRLTHVLAFWVE